MGAEGLGEGIGPAAPASAVREQSSAFLLKSNHCDRSSVPGSVTLLLLMRQSLSCKVLLMHLNMECLFFKPVQSWGWRPACQTPSVPCGDELVSFIQGNFVSGNSVRGLHSSLGAFCCPGLCQQCHWVLPGDQGEGFLLCLVPALLGNVLSSPCVQYMTHFGCM